MSYFNFDQEATVSWSDKPIFGDVHGGVGNTRPFKTLREALIFVTEELDERLRKHSWLMTEGHTYHGDDIADLKAKLVAQA